MKMKYIIPLIAFLPLTVHAGIKMDGTPDLDGNSHGDLQDNGVKFNVAGGGKVGAYGMYGTSNVNGQWWGAATSTTPWNTFVPEGTDHQQPSFHVTDDLQGGSEFFVGLSTEFELNGYSSALRMVNANGADLFGKFTGDVEVYFGVRNFDITAAINAGGARANAIEAKATGGVGVSLTVAAGLQNPRYEAPANATFKDSFDWVHYTTDKTSVESVTDADGHNVGIGIHADINSSSITEWVVYFVLPDEPAVTIENQEWLGLEPPTAPEAINDLVFSWTVHPKEASSPTPNPEYPDGPGPNIYSAVPEPSSALMLFAGAGLLFCRRNRKAA